MNEHKAIKIYVSLLLFVFSSVGLQALDFPVFYRAPLFQGTPKKDLENWTTHVSAGYATGSGRKAWDQGGKKVPLLDVYGLVNGAYLGIGVQDQQTLKIPGKTPVSFADKKKPITSRFWNDVTPTAVPSLGPDDIDNNNFDPSGTLGIFANDRLVPDPESLAKTGISICGKTNVQQFDLLVHQNILAGFFAQVYLPIREVEVYEINLRAVNTDKTNPDKGATTPDRGIAAAAEAVDKLLNGKSLPDGTEVPPTETDPAKIAAAVNNFELVLREHCLSKPRAPFKKSGVSDLLVSVGWQARDDKSFGSILKSLEGSAQLGILVPLAAKKDENHLYSVGLGHNQQWGAQARFYAEAGIFNIFAVGAQAGVTAFIKSVRELRMKTHENQSGIIVLDKGKADVDQGSIWDLGAYAKVHNFAKGLSALVGYSFTRQEPTRLNAEEDRTSLLEEVVDRELNKRPDNTKRFISKNEIVNTDERLKGWEFSTIHFLVQYDFRAHKDIWFAPLVNVSYSAPVSGKRVWIVDMIGGNFGITINWNF